MMMNFCSRFFFTLANSADPDEMPPYGAFHLGLNCLLKYLFNGIQIEKKVKQNLNLDVSQELTTGLDK